MTAQHPRAPSGAGVAAAMARIAAILPPTPLLPLPVAGVAIHAKAECLQPIGAFKIRGAWNRLCALSAAERAAGVVGVSSGNHAQGVAWAARRLGIRAAIVMPVDAPAVKLARTRELGAEVVLYDRPGGEDRDEVAARLCAQRGATLVHAYADAHVIEGQGTAGLEIAAQLGRAPSRIIAPCGGGGLSAGLALACPDSAIIGVEPAGWDDVAQSLAAGRIVPVARDAPPTACDALQTPATRPINFSVLRARGVTVRCVTEAEIRAAQRLAFDRLRLVVEPGGAAGLAAVLAGRVAVDEASVVVLSGGNTDPASFARVLMEA